MHVGGMVFSDIFQVFYYVIKTTNNCSVLESLLLVPPPHMSNYIVVIGAKAGTGKCGGMLPSRHITRHGSTVKLLRKTHYRFNKFLFHSRVAIGPSSVESGFYESRPTAFRNSQLRFFFSTRLQTNATDSRPIRLPALLQ